MNDLASIAAARVVAWRVGGGLTPYGDALAAMAQHFQAKGRSRFKIRRRLRRDGDWHLAAGNPGQQSPRIIRQPQLVSGKRQIGQPRLQGLQGEMRRGEFQLGR